MTTAKRVPQTMRNDNSNAFLSNNCTGDACSHFISRDILEDNIESQRAKMFLNGSVPSYQGDHNDESCVGGHITSTTHPSKEISHDHIDKLLASDLNSLSLQERDAVYDEIHGVADLIVETALFVQTNLDALRDEITKIQSKPAYDRAMVMKPDYVQDPAFCLKFLRAKRFNAKAAATQLVAHLEFKQELFGTHRLCRDIELSDLDKDDQVLLRSGAYPFIKTRDRAGRAIFFFINCLLQYKSIESWARTIYFIVMSHIREEEVQRRGLVVVAWMHETRTSSLTQKDLLLWTRRSRISETMPLRVSGGVHYCAAGTRLHPGLGIGMAFSSRYLRIRFRTYVGSPLECLYNLASYGIPLHALPIDVDGRIVLDEHLKWVEQQAHLSSAANDASCHKTGLLTPGPTDVLMGGKSREFQCNPGNVALRRMVQDAFPSFFSADVKATKTIMTMEIVQKIKSDGGRFLLRDGDFSWKEVDNETARQKVAHAFRNQLRTVKKKYGT